MLYKSNLKLSLLFFVLVLVLSSCKKNNLPSGGVNDIGPSPDLMVRDENLSLTYRGGEAEVIILASGDWEAQTDDDWIKITNSRGTRGKDTINIIIDENVDETREGSIMISLSQKDISKEVVISQGSGISLNWFVKEGSTGVGHSWKDATDLADALKNAAGGDTILVAAGTYRPSYVIMGGDEDDSGDLTFGIDKNITIIGGYPANPNFSSEPDPENNKTILSGDLEGINTYHVVSIYAKKDDVGFVKISGVTIEQGIALGDNSVSVLGSTFSRNIGGGIIIGKSKVYLEDVKILNNKAYQSAGIEATNEVDLTMKNCQVSDNESNSNGGGIHLANSSVAYIYNTKIENNKASVGAGIYAYPNSELYLYNCLINNNDGGNNTGIGVYYREGSSGFIVNSQIANNKGKGGSGLQLYLNCTVAVISSTISNNVSTGSNGGFRIYDNGNKFSIYNSIVSGNIQNSGKDYVIEAADYTAKNSVLATEIWGSDGTINTSLSFNPSIMLNNKFVPVGTDNPAIENGMSVSELNSINGSIDQNYLKEDINGKSRHDSRVMGAFLP